MAVRGTGTLVNHHLCGTLLQAWQPTRDSPRYCFEPDFNPLQRLHMTPPPAFLSNVESPVETASLKAERMGELDPQSQMVTAPYVGQWHTLISQTNWDKGRIISEWRTALIAAEATSNSFSDETWAKQVGAVTSQHVGRLRRVFEHFGQTAASYPGLYWSHFLAAIDWDDAELWLEGAMRSNWSISEMRKTRWESSGGDPKNAPRDEELITSEVDEDFDALTAEVVEESDREKRDRAESSGPLAEGPDFGDEDYEPSIAGQANPGDPGFESESFDASKEQGNPFVALPDLPPDIADALEQFKLSIVRHRASKWADITQKQMLDVLDALKLFVDR